MRLGVRPGDVTKVNKPAMIGAEQHGRPIACRRKRGEAVNAAGATPPLSLGRLHYYRAGNSILAESGGVCETSTRFIETATAIP